MNMAVRQAPATTNLAALLAGIADAPAIGIEGIASDSRKVAAGYLFLACGGESGHGLDYLGDALARGAAAVAYEPRAGDESIDTIPVPALAVEGLGARLGEIANRFYAHPSRSLRVIGITGTNGKTTVAWLAMQCLERLGHPCGYVGTLGAGVGAIESTGQLTTPSTVDLHELLAGFRDRNARYATLEVSSHALAQRRVDGVEFDTVLFTNLSRDHLDYHGDMQGYAEAKARLFTDYGARNRIINVDTGFGAELARRCGNEAILVSTSPDCTANGRRHLLVESVSAAADGSRVRFRSSWGDGNFFTPLPGDFNVANATIVLAMLCGTGTDVADACAVMPAVSAPPGRMQRVPVSVGAPAVYVDFAHTPAGIEVALRALRDHSKGTLWCVFGCGGERDAGKRPQMGRIAEQLADRLVLTSDNPRGESPDGIIADIAGGLTQPRDATVIVDRGAAIAWAVAAARPQDVVLIAGKGHENYQDIGGERREFSDYATALACLEKYRQGAEGGQ